VVAAARAAELLGIGRTSSESIARSRNKYVSRETLRAAGLPVPGYALMHGADDAAAIAERVGLPAVIKPVNGAGSHLVESVRTVEELRTAYRKIADRLLDVPQLRHFYTKPLDVPGGSPIDPTRTFLVEGMLRGPEYCIDFVVRDGVIEQLPLVDKFLDDKYFERGFFSPPFDLDPERERLIGDAVEQAVTALGLDNTVGNIDLIDDEVAGPTIVEVNGGRPGGQLLGTLHHLRTGVNTAAELVALARNVPAERETPPLPIPLATLTLFPEQTGRLTAIHGLDELAELPEVLQVVCSVRPGDVVTDDYEVFAVNVVVAGFADHDDLEQVYAQADALVRFDVEPL
jgi:biotin carboxylase